MTDSANSRFPLDERANTDPRAVGHRATFDARVSAVIERLDTAAMARQRLTIETIAETAGIDPAHLGRLIKQETGFKFTAWRSAFLLRPSLRPLVDTGEDVKQIGCRLLGFNHLSQFDREFRRLFGLTPTEFRRALQDPRYQ
jgi:AraC-like DNA-binding protein